MRAMKSAMFARVYGTPPSEEPKDGEMVSRGTSDDPRIERENIYDCASEAMAQLRGKKPKAGSGPIDEAETDYDGSI